jgi:hypothetical protein
MEEQGVYERPAPDSGASVGDHSGRFFDDRKIIIFIKNGERDIFGAREVFGRLRL